MKYGVAFPQSEIEADPVAIRDYAQAVEEMGYDHITCLEHVVQSGTPAGPPHAVHYTIEKEFHEVFILLTFIAAATKTIGLATAILVLPQRQAVLAAKQAAQLDLLSGGRLRLGVGLGWCPPEFEALGEDFHSRGARLAEQIEVMRLLWTERLVTYEGTWHRLTNVGINPGPVQRPIPVWVGAFADVAIRRAGRVADGWFINPRVTPDDELARQVSVFRQAAAEADREPDSLGIEATVYARGTPDEWLGQVEDWRRMGAEHITFRTRECGFTKLDQHLEKLREFKALAPG